MHIMFKKSSFRTLVLAGAAVMAGGFSASAADFSSDQKGQIETVVHDYLLKNPKVLVEALEKYQTDMKDAQAGQFKDKVGKYKDFLTSKDAPSAGNPNGDVTMTEFFDYNCGYCKHAVDDVKALIDSDKKVRVVFIDFPILSESSGDAARYALAAQKQGKYYEYHLKLMKYPGEKNETAYRSIAKDLNLDWDKLQKDANSDEIKQKIMKNMEVARDLNISGTPGFIVGDQLVPGYMGVENMKQLVADARNKK